MLSPVALVVDDEPLIAQLVETSLLEAGFEVVVVHNVDEAKAKIDDLGAGLSTLVTDVRLGAGSGWVVAVHARERNPNLPIVYMTGDSAEAWKVHGVPDSVLIEKPFVGAQVVTAVTTLMNAGSHAASSEP